MNREAIYTDITSEIASGIKFMNNANSDCATLLSQIDKYAGLLKQQEDVLNWFPSYRAEIAGGLSLAVFNIDSAAARIEEFNSALPKLAYISDILSDLKEMNDPGFEAKLNVSAYKNKFQSSAEKLVFRSIDTLHFEMKQFEEKFRSAAIALNNEAQKRQKVKTLMMQDSPLFVQFPKVKAEMDQIISGTNTSAMGADYVIANYVAIKGNLSKLNELSTYFTRLSRDYLAILNPQDLQLFPAVKTAVTLSSLSGEFIRLNAKGTECKNRMLKLDTLRTGLSTLRRDVSAKIGDLQPNHQQYVQTEVNAIEQLLGVNVTRDFERAEQKLNTVREILKKEFKTKDDRVSLSFTIRQTISRFENNMFEEDTQFVRAELEKYANGASSWRKEDFDEAIQSFIRGKNETIADVRNEFELYLSKNRDYKNKLEKIANTKSSKVELEALLKEMGSFKLIKTGFYKFLK